MQKSCRIFAVGLMLCSSKVCDQNVIESFKTDKFDSKLLPFQSMHLIRNYSVTMKLYAVK